jgi:hypothetical protein
MREVVWKDEFASIDLRDGRLNRRFYQIMAALSDQPLAPINQALELARSEGSLSRTVRSF